MKAAVLHEPGGKPRLEEFDAPEPAPGRPVGRVLAAGLNPIDVIIAAGGFRFRSIEPPCVAGFEGVAELESGARVYFSGPPAPYGSLAELVPVDEADVLPVPAGLDPSLALAVGGVPGLAAWSALTDRARLSAGELALVLGAGGSAGRLAVQAAKVLGAGRVVAADRSERSLRRAAELGAEDGALISSDPAAFEQALQDASPGGYDVVVDFVWGDVIQHVINVASDGARIAQVGSAAGAAAPIVAPVFRNKLISIVGHSNFLMSADERRRAFAALTRLALDGRLVADVEETKLADIESTWDRLKAGGAPKLIVTP